MTSVAGGADRLTRWNSLLQLLAEQERVTVEQAAERLGVSQATIRRDFDELAQQHMIIRTRGGACATSGSDDLPLRYKSARHAEQKQRIGAAAAALVGPGMVVGLNGGTTTTEAARALAGRVDLNGRADLAGPAGSLDEPRLTVVTNALTIANQLLTQTRMRVVVTGGVVRPQSLELVGPIGGGAVLHDVTIDVALLGVDAIDPRLGPAAHHEGEAAVSGLIAGRARRVVIIADSSKLGSQAFARICPVERVDTLVTDVTADPHAVAEFEKVGVTVTLV